MSARMHSKQSRAWERGSSGRRHRGGERGSPARHEHFRQRELGSPERSKRSRWESPSRNRMDSPGRMRRRVFESPPRAGRKEVGSPPKSRKSGFDDGLRPSFGERHRDEDGLRPSFGFDDGLRPSFGERHRAEEEYRLRAMHQEGHKEGRRPAGLVFLCSSVTLRECFHYRVLGLPAAQRDIVERVVPGTKLFLFNFDTKELFGVFEAASHGGLNLVPEAFQDSKGSYAAQVRFNIFRECLPLADDVARDVLRDNFSQRGKFDCELSANQVLKIVELFSHPEMRFQHPGSSGPGRDNLAQERKNTPLRVNASEPDGGHISSALQGSHVHENNFFSEAQVLMNKPLADGTHSDPAAVLGQGMIEEVDQLALKYLQNDPGFAGIRLDPVNTSLLSNSLRNNPQLGFSNPSMDHGQAGMPPGANFIGFSVQPNGLQQGAPLPTGVNGILNPRLLGHPGISVPDSVKKDNTEHSINDGGKLLGHFLPGSIPTERGLLPIPGMHHQIPLQPGMIYPFPVGTVVQNAFPMVAGPAVGARPELGGPFLPFHPLQGPHMIPPHLMNHPQLMNHPPQVVNPPQAVNHPNNAQMTNHPNNHLQAPPKSGNKPKKNKQKKFRAQKGVGGDGDKKKDARADAIESSAAKPAS